MKTKTDEQIDNIQRITANLASDLEADAKL